MKATSDKRVTFEDLSLKSLDLTKRVKEQRAIYFRAMPEICTERG